MIKSHLTTKESLLIISIPQSILTAFFLIIGILLQAYSVPFYFLYFLWIGVALLYGLSLLQHQPNSRLFYLTIILLGAALYKNYTDRQHAWFDFINNQPATFSGLITDMQEKDHKYLKYSYQTLIDEFTVNGKRYDILGTKRLIIYAPYKINITPGNRYHFRNIALKPPAQKLKPFFIKEHIIGSTITTKSSHDPIMQHDTWYAYIMKKRQQLFEAIQQQCSQHSSRMFSLLFLGKKLSHKQIGQLKDDCKYWGISHYLARSGLHLVIILMTWQIFLRAIPISFWLKEIIISVLALLYLLFSWPTISFMRSFLLLGAYKYGIFFDKPIHILNILSLICISFLCANPYYLFFLDFQLSFGCTFILAWIEQLQRRNIANP